MTEFSVTVMPNDIDGVVTLKPKGNIDSVTTPVVESYINMMIHNENYHIVIDLSETEFISSSGFGVFFGTVADLREKGGDLVLLNTPQAIIDVLEVLNIASYFRTITNIAEIVPQA